MKILIGRDHDEFSEMGAKYVADFIRANPGKLICLAAGDTPLGIYKRLAEMQKRGEIDLNSMYYAGLDEWAGIGYETKGSCAQVMRDNFYGPAGIECGRMRVFDGLAADLEKECKQVSQWVKANGGVAFTILGIGMNGHIGFNEPNTDPEKDALVVDLDAVTADVGRKYFHGAACPVKGMTLGVKTLKAADEVVLAVSGSKKGNILRKTLTEGPSTAIPSSLMRNCSNLTVLTDESAFRAMWGTEFTIP